MNLPAAGSCLCAENSELRVLAPSRLAPTSIQGPRAWGATQRLVGRFARLQSKSARAHARITQLDGSRLVSSPSSERENQKKKNLPLLGDGAEGTPSPPSSPRASSASQRGTAAWGLPGCGPLPGNFCLARAQVWLRQARTPGRGKQKRTLLLRAGGGTQALDQLFPLLAPCAPCPARGIQLPAARCVIGRGVSWSGRRPRGPETCAFS